MINDDEEAGEWEWSILIFNHVMGVGVHSTELNRREDSE